MHLKEHSDSLFSAITGALATVIFTFKQLTFHEWLIQVSVEGGKIFCVALVGGVGGWIGKKLIEFIWRQIKYAYRYIKNSD